MSATYEEILQGMLNKVTNEVDKREGSIIYDALAPCAYFLAQQQFQIEHFFDLVFADTAIGDYLDRAAMMYGLTRKEATAAVRIMTTSTAIENGTRWGINGLVYNVTGKRSENEYIVTCETPGEIGNQYSGNMEPISNISNVTATLEGIDTPGTDAETDDAFRERLYAKIKRPATSGNAYHYRQWALEVAGVGDAKVFPLDNGLGTVTVLVVDDEKNISSALPATVSRHIETVRPIGATVTVSSPEALPINISANVVLDGSKTISEVKSAFKEELTSFLKEMTFITYRVSYAKLGSLLLDIPGVEDFDNFRLNSGTGNVTISEKQIPVIGTIALTEVSVLGVD